MIGRRIPTQKSARVKPVATPQTPSSKSLPSVPISVFRELSADLQTSQANISNLQSENLQLAEENQQLREELAQLATQTQQVLHKFQHSAAGNIADEALMLDELGFDAKSAQARSQVLSQIYREMPDYAPADDRLTEPTGIAAPLQRLKAKPRKLIYEQAQNPLQTLRDAANGELSGWKLTLVMALIIFSAFGAGFLVVRPLISPAANR